LRNKPYHIVKRGHNGWFFVFVEIVFPFVGINMKENGITVHYQDLREKYYQIEEPGLYVLQLCKIGYDIEKTDIHTIIVDCFEVNEEKDGKL
jgi:hypothetical protein